MRSSPMKNFAHLQSSRSFWLGLLILETVICLVLVLGVSWAIIWGPFSQSQEELPVSTLDQTQVLSRALTDVVASLTAAASTPNPVPSATPLPPASPLPPTPTLAPTLTPTPAPTATPSPDPWVELTLSQMSLEQKIGQMLMIGVDGQSITPAACSLLRRLSPGAIVYTGGNVISPQQLRAFSAGLQDCARQSGDLPLWIAMDHEGQYVDRFENGAAVFPAAMAVGATGDPNQAYLAALASGQELVFSGVNLVLGPDADVLTNFDNSVISLRSYGGDPAVVSQFVAQAVRGYLAAGLAPVLKHFPGHGGTTSDTHDVLAVDSADEAALRQSHLPPFQAGVAQGAPVVMFSHVAFPTLEGVTQPASLSPLLVDLLHRDLSFQGFTLTDSMGMGAIKNTYGDVGAAGLKAVSAGIDILLTTSAESAQSAYNALLFAARNGQLPLDRIDQAVRRILTAKSRWGLTQFPVAQGATPDWNADQGVAYDIAFHAITVLRDQSGLIPLTDARSRLLVIGPSDGWGLYPPLQRALQEAGFTYRLVTFSGSWNGSVPERNYLQSLPAQAASYDLVLVFTWEAHLNRLRYGDNFQAELVNKLLSTGTPVVVIALKSPTDLLEFPHAPTFLATFGTTAGQIQGVVDILVGKTGPTGSNPLPALPSLPAQ
jgi:beta-N-acetylhexosaminidase